MGKGKEGLRYVFSLKLLKQHTNQLPALQPHHGQGNSAAFYPNLQSGAVNLSLLLKRQLSSFVAQLVTKFSKCSLCKCVLNERSGRRAAARTAEREREERDKSIRSYLVMLLGKK
jgi:hypothetical protein